MSNSKQFAGTGTLKGGCLDSRFLLITNFKIRTDAIFGWYVTEVVSDLTNQVASAHESLRIESHQFHALSTPLVSLRGTAS
jgi:hypothetical protein